MAAFRRLCNGGIEMTFALKKLPCALGACVVALASAYAGAQSSANISSDAIAQRAGNVAVSGNRLLRDGAPWIPHGFYQIAFEVPPSELPMQKPFWTVAAQDYSPAEYAQMREFGADSVRIQVAQPGMDPQDPRSTPDFREKVTGAIRAARAAGLIVIVSVQDEPQTGDPKRPVALPGDATQHIWRVLAPAFGNDRGVMFELFNEPHIGPQAVVPFPPADWNRWAQTMNRTVATIRSFGARNVIVADGLQFAQQLAGAPELADPLHQVVYAAHPYSLNARDQSSAVWDAKFGNFARTRPVLISEWGIGYYCDPDTPQATVDFIAYLNERGIGLEAGSWDWASAGFGSAIYNFPDNRVSTFVGPKGGQLACHWNGNPKGYTPGYGIGKLVQTWYRTGSPSGVIQ
jgi:endoglucanase